MDIHIHSVGEHPLLIEYQYLSDAVKSYALLCDYHYLRVLLLLLLLAN